MSHRKDFITVETNENVWNKDLAHFQKSCTVRDDILITDQPMASLNHMPQHKMQMSVAIKLITLTGIYTCKAAKLCHCLSKDGNLILTPCQSAVYKALFRSAATAESFAINNLGMTMSHIFIRSRKRWSSFCKRKNGFKPLMGRKIKAKSSRQ